MVLNPVVRLIGSQELFDIFILLLKLPSSISMVSWQLVKDANIVRIVHRIWLKLKFKVFHARFNLLFISEQRFLRILILTDSRHSLSDLRIHDCHVFVSLFALIFKNVWNARCSNGSNSLYDLLLR